MLHTSLSFVAFSDLALSTGFFFRGVRYLKISLTSAVRASSYVGSYKRNLSPKFFFPSCVVVKC
jgi:hypothetical protein